MTTSWIDKKEVKKIKHNKQKKPKYFIRYHGSAPQGLGFDCTFFCLLIFVHTPAGC